MTKKCEIIWHFFADATLNMLQFGTVEGASANACLPWLEQDLRVARFWKRPVTSSNPVAAAARRRRRVTRRAMACTRQRGPPFENTKWRVCAVQKGGIRALISWFKRRQLAGGTAAINAWLRLMQCIKYLLLLPLSSTATSRMKGTEDTMRCCCSRSPQSWRKSNFVKSSSA
jgi:hypothetical protein